MRRLFCPSDVGNYRMLFPSIRVTHIPLCAILVELFFGINAAGPSGNGVRGSRMMCNRNTLLDDFSIYKEVSDYRMLTKTFYHLNPMAQKKLNLTFELIQNYAIVSGLEIWTNPIRCSRLRRIGCRS